MAPARTNDETGSMSEAFAGQDAEVTTGVASGGVGAEVS